MTSFLRFLSKRAKSSSETNRLNKHQKLNGCEDLKEALDNLNNRNIQIKQQQQQQQQTTSSIKTNNLNGIEQNIKQQKQSRFFSFKSLEKYRSKATTTNTNTNGEIINTKDSIECAVIFLDGSDARFFIDKKSNAEKLYEKVYYHLDLIETDYFGLQFTDTHNVQHWLDPSKCIRKQCKIGPPYTFFFKVKFYTSEPNNLKEEITRYLYFLQLKSDIRTGKVPCTQAITIELSALILQEELGDYDSGHHNIETVSEFRFVPDSEQNEEVEELILKQYKTKCVGLTPAEAELMYLNKAKWLEMYGVDMHQVFGRDQNEYKLGLTPSGILVFEGDQKIGLFYWPKIEKITFSKKKFTIIVTEDDDRGLKQEHTFIFHLIDQKACKHLWKCAVEYHAFFRLRSAPKQANSGISGFIRRGSRFRGPQRTEFQTTNSNVSTRRSVQFERRPSQRFSRRASYAIKRKLQEQQKVRGDQNQQVPTLSTIVSSNDVSEAPTKAVAGALALVPKKETTSNLIEIDSFTKQQSSAAAASSSVNSSTIKEEAENAQAKLKQIEIESEKPIKQQPPPVPARQQPRINPPLQSPPSSIIINSDPPPLPPLPASTTQKYGNCCKLQQSSGGVEHDTKCNLLKAQQIKKTEQHQSAAAAAAAVTNSLASSTCSVTNESTSLIQTSDHKKSSCSSCETCSKEAQAKSVAKCDIEEEKFDDNFQIIDRNEQQSDDRVKLIDKELISSITTKTSKNKTPKEAADSTPAVAGASSSYIKESSFIGPTSIKNVVESTITSATPSNSNDQQPQVVITRTQSIYTDGSATASFLHINQNAKSTSFNSSSSSAAITTQATASRRPNHVQNYKPITTEL